MVVLNEHERNREVALLSLYIQRICVLPCASLAMVEGDPLATDLVGPDLTRLTRDDRFTILAIDHGNVLRRQVDAQSADSTPLGIEQAKLAVVQSLAPRCSAVLADLSLVQHPEFLRTMSESKFGLLVSVDEADYDEVHQPAPAIPDIDTVRRAKFAGASALKVVVYYDRDQVDSIARLDRVAAIAELSGQVGLPLLVEPLPFGPDLDAGWPVALVARDMAEAGAAIVKVPLPHGTGADVCNLAKEITDALGPIPWVLLSSGSSFPLFLDKLRNAMAGGASGFAAGRSLWDDLITRPHDARANSDALERLDRAVEAATGHSYSSLSDGSSE